MLLLPRVKLTLNRSAPFPQWSPENTWPVSCLNSEHIMLAAFLCCEVYFENKLKLVKHGLFFWTCACSRGSVLASLAIVNHLTVLPEAVSLWTLNLVFCNSFRLSYGFLSGISFHSLRSFPDMDDGAVISRLWASGRSDPRPVDVMQAGAHFLRYIGTLHPS